MNNFVDVVNYWFEDSHDYKKWFFGGLEMDHFIRIHFKDLLDETIQNMHTIQTDKLTSAEYLGLIILLDQFSRHIYRNTSKAFQQDAFSLQLSRQLLLDKKMHLYSPQEQLFALMPLQHSETLSDKTVLLDYANRQLSNCLPEDKNTFTSLIEHTLGHQNVLNKYGRYPKRNKALARSSTPAECVYIKSSNSSY